MRIAASSLKGYILEEVLAYLIRNAGYRLLTDASEDRHELRKAPHGLTVRGRGCWHQADVLGELVWNPAFTHPIRLFVEAKWREHQRIGIEVVREAVGIIEDLRQNIAVTRMTDPCVAPNCPAELEYVRRTRRYDYRYVIFSTSGFTKDAARYALAHQVSLIDLGIPQFAPLRQIVHEVGERIFQRLIRAVPGEDIQDAGDDGEASQERRTSGQVIETTRYAVRELLYGDEGQFSYDYAVKNRPLLPVVKEIVRPIVKIAKKYGEIFIGMAAGGVMIVLTPDTYRDRLAFVAALKRRQKIEIGIYYERNGRGEVESTWIIVPELEARRTRHFKLLFRVPDLVFEHIKQNDRASEVLSTKFSYFSQITVYRIDRNESIIGQLALTRTWYQRAWEEIA